MGEDSKARTAELFQIGVPVMKLSKGFGPGAVMLELRTKPDAGLVQGEWSVEA